MPGLTVLELGYALYLVRSRLRTENPCVGGSIPPLATNYHRVPPVILCYRGTAAANNTSFINHISNREQGMRLYSIEYTEYAEHPYTWSLNDLTLININLIVGRNAVGKTPHFENNKMD